MNSARVRRLVRISLTDPYLTTISLLFAAALLAANQQANLYEVQNPRWVLTMGLLILLSPLVHSLFFIRVRAILQEGPSSIKHGLAASAVLYPRLVIGEVLVSLVAAAGLFLLLLPGIYIGLRLSFYKQAIIFEEKSLAGAVRESMARTASWPVLGLILLVLSPVYGMEILIGYLAGAFLPAGWGIVSAVLASAAGFSLMNTFLTVIYLERGNR